jgi:hypothetical protein
LQAPPIPIDPQNISSSVPGAWSEIPQSKSLQREVKLQPDRSNTATSTQKDTFTPSKTLKTLPGIVKLWRPLQLRKTAFPIELKLAGSAFKANESHPSKAESPTCSKTEGNVSSAKDSHL